MENAQTPLGLAAALRRESGQLPTAAREAAALLESYAVRILQPSQSAVALEEFVAFANHYKGLRDIVVPEVSVECWFAAVERMRAASRIVLRREGLDRSFVGRLHHLFSFRGGRDAQDRA